MGKVKNESINVKFTFSSAIRSMFVLTWGATESDLLVLVTRLCVNSQEENLKIVKHKWNKWWAWTNAADSKKFFTTAAL